MADLDRTLLRKLAEWTPRDIAVTSVYLNVDGRRLPRRQDYEVHLDELLRRVREQAEELSRDAQRSVDRDVEEIRSFVVDRFDRGATRGLAMFSCSAEGLREEIELPRPVRNQAIVGPHPDLLQLENLLEVYESFCTVLVDGSKARLFLAELGRIEEQSDLLDDVPNRHDQGGWSQARFQRHVEEHRQRHLKRTAEVLLRFHKRRPFDHLIVSGQSEVLAEFERELHDYLKRRIRARINLPTTATEAEVLERSLQVEEDLERERERGTVERLAAGAGAGRQAAVGLTAVLAALEEARVATLLVDADLRAPGRECPQCGRLSREEGTCRSCGERTRAVADVVEAAVAQAVRKGCRVETVTEPGPLSELGGIGALLRF